MITLGLIEAWKFKKNGLWVCRCPVKADDPEWHDLELWVLGYNENCHFLENIINLLKKYCPHIHIILSVSPVPLGRTFTNQDVVVANTESKSTLRALAGEMIRKYSGFVSYWPSFEYAIYRDVYEQDGRHVKKEHVRNIIDGFLSSYQK